MSDLVFGLWLTAVGMTIVFALLALLWGMLALVARLGRETETAEGTTPPAQAPDIDEEEAAAITIAVLAHGELRRRQAAPEMRTTVPGSQIWASRWLAAGRTRQTRGWQGRR